MLKILFSISILIGLLSVSSFSDVIFEIEYKEAGSQTPDKTTAYVKNDILKMDFYEGSTNPVTSMIYRPESNEMITLDHNEKRFYVMDKNTMNQLSGQMNSAMQQMQEAMKDMSPQEREMMENMMKSKLPSVIQNSEYVEPVLKEAGSTSVNTYTCNKYEVYRGSEKIRQYCITDWSNIDGGGEIKNSILKMSEFMEEFKKSFTSAPNMFTSSIEFERNIFMQMSKLNGFPVQTIDYKNGNESAVSIFKSSKKTTLNDTVLSIPAGYNEQKISM